MSIGTTDVAKHAVTVGTDRIELAPLPLPGRPLAFAFTGKEDVVGVIVGEAGKVVASGGFSFALSLALPSDETPHSPYWLTHEVPESFLCVVICPEQVCCNSICIKISGNIVHRILVVAI